MRSASRLEDTQEVAGMVRSALDKGEDLRDFLNTLAGYLPFPYLTEKIVTGSNNLKMCGTQFMTITV